MKRVLFRPGKAIFVSDDALTRARAGLKAFGATPEAMAKLSSFKGDTTIGLKRARNWVSATTGSSSPAAAPPGAPASATGSVQTGPDVADPDL